MTTPRSCSQVGVDAGALRGLVVPRWCLLDTEAIGTVVGEVEPRHSRDFQPFFTASLTAVPEALKAIGVGAAFGDEGGVDAQGLLMVGRDDPVSSTGQALGNGRLVEGDEVKGPVVPARKQPAPDLIRGALVIRTVAAEMTKRGMAGEHQDKPQQVGDEGALWFLGLG